MARHDLLVLTHVDHITLAVPDLTVALDFFTGLGFARRLSARGASGSRPARPSDCPVARRHTLDGIVIDHIAFNTGDRAASVAAPTKAGEQSGQPADRSEKTTATPAKDAGVAPDQQVLRVKGRIDLPYRGGREPVSIEPAPG